VEYIASKSQSSETKIREAAKASSFGSELIQAALAVNNKVTLFHFEDQLRQHAADVIKSLKVKTGLRLLMLTGDHAASAQRVANAVGIEEVYYGLKPEDKLHKVKDLSRQRDKSSGGLIMVGDGINDAPALAAASVGIVLAKRASATAIAVADVLLLQDALDGVAFVIAKARQTDALVKQSVALALSCIFLASLPSILGVLPLWLTVLLHEGGTLLVCVNSARAFHDPTSSSEWKEALSRLVKRSLALLGPLFRMKNSTPAIQTAPAVLS
jgi:Cd2+/Zn2+-exporting ATPase